MADSGRWARASRGRTSTRSRDCISCCSRRFINDGTKNRFDIGAGTAHLSKIFKWFREDFEAAGGLQLFLARFVADPEVARGLSEGMFTLRYLEYDWSLNGTFDGAAR